LKLRVPDPSHSRSPQLNRRVMRPSNSPPQTPPPRPLHLLLLLDDVLPPEEFPPCGGGHSLGGGLSLGPKTCGKPTQISLSDRSTTVRGDSLALAALNAFACGEGSPGEPAADPGEASAGLFADCPTANWPAAVAATPEVAEELPAKGNFGGVPRILLETRGSTTISNEFLV